MQIIEFFNNNSFFILIVGLVLIAVGLYQNIRIHKIKKKGVKTVAKIVDYIAIEDKYSESYNRIFYSPVVKFNDKNGTKRSVISGIGTSYKPTTILPKKIEISYFEEHGRIEILILDSIFLDIMAMSFLLSGIILTLLTIYFYFNKI